MKFTDSDFLPFVLLVLGAWLVLRRHYWPTILLLVGASLWFYGYRGEERLPLIASYCLVDWWVGRMIPRSRRPRTWLAAGIAFNLGVLCYYKYTPMLTFTAAEIAGALGSTWTVAPDAFARWQIPFGLSFYAFTGVAYLVDVYTRRAEYEPNFLRYTLYLSFFPQLMAGPILRPGDFLNQLQPGRLPGRWQNLFEAVFLIGRGAFKKMVLADRIAVAIDPYFENIGTVATAGVWSLPYLYLYALQIYFDFSGYTDMARGLGLLFGFRWPRNFMLPYLATSIREFWRRWHITLSAFLRDMLYIPLGGNRHGHVRTSVNLMVTMLLGGLWHGASWSFMIWGGLHGAYLLLHRLWEYTPLAVALRPRSRLATWLHRGAGWFVTFHLVVLAWGFFRLTSLGESLQCVGRMFFFDPSLPLANAVLDPLLLGLLGLYAVHAFVEHRAKERVREGDGYSLAGLAPFLQGVAWGDALMLLLLGIFLAPTGVPPAFIYFQF